MGRKNLTGILSQKHVPVQASFAMSEGALSLAIVSKTIMRVLKATTTLLSVWLQPKTELNLHHHCIDLFVRPFWVYVQVGSPETFLFTVAPSQGSPRLVAEDGASVRRFFLLLLCFAASAFLCCVVNCARH